MRNQNYSTKNMTKESISSVKNAIDYVCKGIDFSECGKMSIPEMAKASGTDYRCALYLCLYDAQVQNNLTKFHWSNRQKFTPYDFVCEYYSLLNMKYFTGHLSGLCKLTDAIDIICYRWSVVRSIKMDCLKALIGRAITVKRDPEPNDTDIQEELSFKEYLATIYTKNESYEEERNPQPYNPWDSIIDDMDWGFVSNALKPAERLIVQLKYEGYSAKEIADMLSNELRSMGIDCPSEYSENNINVIYHRAKSRIEKLSA